MNKKLIRKMLTAAGGGLVYDDGRNIERTNYNNWSKLSFVDKMKRRFNIAKHLFNESSSPIINSVGAIFGEYDPENPDLNTGIVNAPGRATPQLILLSAKLMETINNYWKNLGKLKIRLGGSGKYASGILTKPGTAPTTFNGLNISYITSPKGGNVTHKFYTDLGSEYILTKDGFARRIKSSHANTGGADSGLHEWNKGATRFLDSDELGWSYQAWTDRTKPLGFSEKDGIISLVTKDNGKWRYVMRSELRPNAVKNKTIKDGIIQSAYTTEPKVGKWILEYGTNPTGEINWFHPGSQVAFIEGLKQGGKMNILEFLKNGSGIHIKEKNKGKFTSYCGGKVTDECIRKAKASGNPTLVKRATFAANARKWKHKKGGKAFINGVSILDSNPDAYKYVKKKMKKAAGGTKLNNETILTIGKTALNGILGFIQTSALNNNLLKLADALKAQNKVQPEDFLSMMDLEVNLEIQNEMEQAAAIKAMTGLTINVNPDMARNKVWKRVAENYSRLKKAIDDLNKAIDALVEAQKQSTWGNLAGGLILSGIGLLGNYLGNKTSTNSNNSGAGWTMNYNSLYGNKNNYNTFFLTGSLPKMSSVAAPNTSWLNNNPLLA